jgi:fructose-specific phosphotransferase system component IIB
MESAKASLGAQNEVTKKHLTDAVAQLEATQKHAAEGLKTSGQAFQNSVKQALADARASVQKASEAVAAMRSPTSTRPPR